MKKVNVEVYWKNIREKSLPNGLKYSTVARFPEDGEGWKSCKWSVVIEFNKPPIEQGNPSIGLAYFLVEDAPNEKLITGKYFFLYEGKNESAKVIVI